MQVGLFAVILWIYIPVEVKNARILGIIWTYSRSHHILGSHLLQTMARRGHEVKLLSTYADDANISNYKQELLNLNDLKEFAQTATTPTNVPGLEVLRSTWACQKAAKHFWEHRAVRELINSDVKYDLALIMEFSNDAILGLAHHVGAPTVLLNPAGAESSTHKFVGNPNLAYFPNPFLSEATGDTFMGRILSATMNCVLYASEQLLSNPIQEKILMKYLPNAPNLSQLQNNVSLVFANSHLSIESPRPHVPNMVQIGGFHSSTAKELPDNLRNYLDSAENGAIFFSLGTNMKIRDLDENKLNFILLGLGKVSPIKVLFKSEINLKQVPDNILVKKWLPQVDILAHPNVKVFISHGGMGGITETIYYGVPMLALPFFGDQKINVHNAVETGYAIPLEFDNITQESFDNALSEILRNPKYIKCAKKYSSLLRKQPVDPLSLSVWWLEHIIEHKGGQHLRNKAMELTWYQLYMVDIMLFYLVLLIIFAVCTIYVTRFIFKKIMHVFVVGINNKKFMKT